MVTIAWIENKPLVVTNVDDLPVSDEIRVAIDSLIEAEVERRFSLKEHELHSEYEEIAETYHQALYYIDDIIEGKGTSENKLQQIQKELKNHL